MSEALAAAIIVDTSHPGAAMRLLGDLTRLAAEDRGLACVEAVVLENPSGEEHPAVGRALRAMGLGFDAVPREIQEREAALGTFGRISLDPGRLPIATARRLIQHYAARFAARLAEEFAAPAAVWILDEDLRLTPLLDAVRRGEPPLSERIRRLRAEGVDVVIGPTLGAPPVPARSSVRVHLEDLRRHLELVAALDPGAPWPDRSAENARVRRELPEYYYDLSRAHGDAGARPMWLEPAFPGETVRSAFARLAAGARGLLDGVPITRAIPEPREAPAGGAALACGGNTLVLRPALLAAIPHVAPRIGGRVSRRSEMLWARLAMTLEGARIARSPVVALHDRTGAGRSSFSAGKLLDDVRGSALVAALDALLEGGALSTAGAVGDAAAARAAAVYAERAGERLAAIRRSEARVEDLLEEIAAMVGGAAPVGHLRHAAHAESAAVLGDAMRRLRAACAERLEGCEPAAEQAEIARFFEDLPEEIAAFRARG